MAELRPTAIGGPMFHVAIVAHSWHLNSTSSSRSRSTSSSQPMSCGRASPHPYSLWPAVKLCHTAIDGPMLCIIVVAHDRHLSSILSSRFSSTSSLWPALVLFLAGVAHAHASPHRCNLCPCPSYASASHPPGLTTCGGAKGLSLRVVLPYRS
jgi:hypothetical protein